MKREQVAFTNEEIKAIERELSAGHNVEIFCCDKGTIIKRIRRETVKLNTEPVKKID